MEVGESLIVSFEATQLGLWFDSEASVARIVRGRRPGDRGAGRRAVVLDASTGSSASFFAGTCVAFRRLSRVARSASIGPPPSGASPDERRHRISVLLVLRPRARVAPHLDASWGHAAVSGRARARLQAHRRSHARHLGRGLLLPMQDEPRAHGRDAHHLVPDPGHVDRRGGHGHARRSRASARRRRRSRAASSST